MAHMGHCRATQARRLFSSPLPPRGSSRATRYSQSIRLLRVNVLHVQCYHAGGPCPLASFTHGRSHLPRPAGEPQMYRHLDLCPDFPYRSHQMLRYTPTYPRFGTDIFQEVLLSGTSQPYKCFLRLIPFVRSRLPWRAAIRSGSPSKTLQFPMSTASPLILPSSSTLDEISLTSAPGCSRDNLSNPASRNFHLALHHSDHTPATRPRN